MNILIWFLALIYFGYGMWLAKTYYDLWQYLPIMHRRLLAFSLLCVLSLAWPVVVPLSYIELLKEQIEISRSLQRLEEAKASKAKDSGATVSDSLGSVKGEGWGFG